MKKLFITAIAVFTAISVFGQYEYKINKRTGRFDMVDANPQYLTTLDITSANILAGDSLLILVGETGIKIIPTVIQSFYNDGTTYTTVATDTTFICTKSNGAKYKIAYITDSFIEGTYDNHSSISVDENYGDTGASYWIDLKNFDDGNGTLTLNFYYMKL